MEEKQQEIISSLVQDYLEVILDNFHDGIYITDKEANTVYLNHSYELISGLLKSEMLGKNMRELVEQGVVSMSGTLSVLKTGESITTEQSFRTGKRAIITSTPIFDKNSDSGNIIMVVTIVREITEIYSIRKELRKKEQLNRKYIRELEQIRKEMDGNVEIVASDKKTVSLIRFAERVAMVDSPILFTGEHGVGRHKMAEFVHKHSGRSDYPFMRINFSVISGVDSVSYLLGSVDEKTGRFQMGVLESASGGTVYIEELADVPEELCGSLLALIQDGACVLGDGMLHRMNIRMIAGSRYTLEELRAMPGFCTELPEAFSTFTVEVPPLRRRKDDIVPLVEFFLHQYNYKSGEEKTMDRDSYMKLLSYRWPGNVMELRNVVQRAAIISRGNVIEPDDLYLQEDTDVVSRAVEDLPEQINLKYEVAKLEADYMERTFAKYGNIREAAESLGMDSSTFVRKRQRYEQMGLMKKQKKKI